MSNSSSTHLLFKHRQLSFAIGFESTLKSSLGVSLLRSEEEVCQHMNTHGKSGALPVPDAHIDVLSGLAIQLSQAEYDDQSRSQPCANVRCWSAPLSPSWPCRFCQ